MLLLIVQNQANGTLAHFWGILVRCLAHDAPSYSGVGASGKPGAVQSHHKSHQSDSVVRWDLVRREAP